MIQHLLMYHTDTFQKDKVIILYNADFC
ncbi:uncharacterized protein METZ01_LOCUS208571 [marine metagenome]|uniref:Uncharacterized protein n=1 Tax=marine metagenome TaxID=408172 RepID=A0A382F0W2_9ZZZZ